jgi:hypothetical protein
VHLAVHVRQRAARASRERPVYPRRWWRAGLLDLLVAVVVVSVGRVTLGTLFVTWSFVALGFNLARTVTLGLLSKQMPHRWNGRISLFIQDSNYPGRVSGAVWGGTGVDVGVQLALPGIGLMILI